MPLNAFQFAGTRECRVVRCGQADSEKKKKKNSVFPLPVFTGCGGACWRRLCRIVLVVITTSSDTAKRAYDLSLLPQRQEIPCNASCRVAADRFLSPPRLFVFLFASPHRLHRIFFLRSGYHLLMHVRGFWSGFSSSSLCAACNGGQCAVRKKELWKAGGNLHVS